MTQEGYFVGSVAGVGRKAESPEQELQYFSPKYSTEILSNFFFNIIPDEEMKTETHQTLKLPLSEHLVFVNSSRLYIEFFCDGRISKSKPAMFVCPHNLVELRNRVFAFNHQSD